MPRILHHLYAFVCGYFWLPCPRCGEYFGGHEWMNHPLAGIDGKGICPACTHKRIDAGENTYPYHFISEKD